MGQEYEKDHEVSKNRRSPPYITFLLVVLTIVGTNALTIYTISVFRGGEDGDGGGRLPLGRIGFKSRSSSNGNSSSYKSLNEELLARSKALQDEVASLKDELKSLHHRTETITIDRTQALLEEVMASKRACTNKGGGEGEPSAEMDNDDPWARWARGPLPAELKRFVESRPLPLGWSPTLLLKAITAPVGHPCALVMDDVEKYMNYEVGAECPDDEALGQKLLVNGCEPLPRRRCFNRIPKNYTEPFPIPDAMWTTPTDDKVVWTAYTCKSFDCLKNRVKEKAFADCLDCFNLGGREQKRWVHSGGPLDITVEEVVRLKNGTIRIGLDLGGGTGTFSVRMREHNVTIVTTTLNFNGPFNTFNANRGVVPMYMTVSQRLPFFDNTLDLVHSMHVLSNWLPPESLEFILYDIDRILRPGGVFWLDHFFCTKPQFATYEPLFLQMGYKKLKWHVGDKLDRGPEMEETYLSALLEKPMKRFSTL